MMMMMIQWIRKLVGDMLKNWRLRQNTDPYFHYTLSNMRKRMPLGGECLKSDLIENEIGNRGRRGSEGEVSQRERILKSDWVTSQHVELGQRLESDSRST